MGRKDSNQTNKLLLISVDRFLTNITDVISSSGGSRISRMGVHMYIGRAELRCWFYLIFLKYPMKMK